VRRPSAMRKLGARTSARVKTVIDDS